MASHEAGVLQLRESVLLPPILLRLGARCNINRLHCGQEIAKPRLDRVSVSVGNGIRPSARYCYIGFRQQTAANWQRYNGTGWATL